MALGGVHLLIGDYQKQTNCFEKSIEVSADPWYQHISKVFLSLGYILNDQLSEAEKPLRDIEAFSNQNNTDWIRTPGRVMQGILLIAKGKMGAGLRMIEEALVTFIKGERRFYAALTEHILGKIYLQMIEGAGPVRLAVLARNLGFLMKTMPFADKKAESHFRNAIRLSEELGANNLLGQAYLDLGLLHKAKKRSDQAKQCVSASIEIFEQGEAKVFLKKAREELTSLG
jgi:tetratricopeptide (TPR) repeat protein